MTVPLRRRNFVPAGAPPLGNSLKASAASIYERSPFKGVDWSPAFIGFLGYIFAITTYRVPIGSVSMVVALLTLPMEKRGIRLPLVASLTIALVAWSFFGMFTTRFPDSVVLAVTDFAKVAGVVLVAVNVLTSRARLRMFLVLVLILYALYPLRGTLFNYFFYGGTVQGRAVWNYAYANPNDLAGLCLLQLANGVAILAVEKKWWVIRGTQITVGLLLLIIVLTQSRGALIGLISFGLISGRKYLLDVKKILMLTVVAIGIVLIAPDSAWRRFSTIEMATTDVMQMDPADMDLATKQDQSSSTQRLEIWKVARARSAMNFIGGVGLGAYPDAHYLMSQRAEFSFLARGHRDTHSTYFGIFAETGVVGFSIFMGMIVLTIVNSWRARKRMSKLQPELSLQLFYLEVGLYAYLVAAIWGTYGTLVPTYIHIALVGLAAKLLLQEGVAPSRGVPQRGGRVIDRAPAPYAAGPS